MKIQGLQILAEELVERGFLLETRAAVTRRIGSNALDIEIGNTGPLEGVTGVESSAAYYLECIRQDRLSWLAFDGSIIQISYRLEGEEMVAHRYCYVPAPFDLDLRGDLGAELGELIEGASVADPLNTARRSMLRFEFDPEAQAENHAASHLHVNSPNCRIPMKGPISVREFVSFLLKFFYSESFNPNILGEAKFEYAACITDNEEKHFHIAWRRRATTLHS